MTWDSHRRFVAQMAAARRELARRAEERRRRRAAPDGDGLNGWHAVDALPARRRPLRGPRDRRAVPELRPWGGAVNVRLYHGGVAGLRVGDLLVPAPPHVTDGCPICVARAEGRTVTIGEYRRWLVMQGERALPVLHSLAGAGDDAPVDPPSSRQAVYVTSDLGYARWYAARSQGDLYAVVACGDLIPSREDHFPTWTTPEARVVEVLERDVRLVRSERREMLRRWQRADKVRAAR